MTDEQPGTDAAAKAIAKTADEQTEDNPQVFVLTRELAEVHLLLDNLSSDPETTINALSSREPPENLDKEWIDQICQISWPPELDTHTKAKQAALLIRARDYLNRLAKPASGASIAFTHLVTKDERDFDPREDRQPGVDIEEVQTRRSLAEMAFPDYEPRARRFRRALRVMNWSLIGVLFLTCFTSWYVAFGNSTLGEYTTAQKRVAAALVRVASLELGIRPGTSAITDPAAKADPVTIAAPTLRSTATAGTPDVDAGIGYCQRWKSEKGPTGETMRRYAGAEQRQACIELEEAEKERNAVAKRLDGWLPGRQGTTEAAAIATHVATILGTAALPVLYGILGAGAAVLRSISHRIKASTLSPRDFNLSLQQLALGAVIGACIGLFIGQPGEEQALIGPVALSISAISFIAGFGVEAVFQAMEALISRIFNIAPAASSRATPPER